VPPGGATLGDVDVGYGPARAFSCEEVQTLARCLEELPPEELASVRDFVLASSRAGMGLLVFLD